jgi:hypothetical protein
VTDPKCSNNPRAYRTLDVDNQQCPTSVNCTQYVAKTGSVDINSEISQHCGINPDAIGGTDNTPFTNTEKGGSPILLILIVLIAVVIIGAVIALIASARSRRQQEEYDYDYGYGYDYSQQYPQYLQYGYSQ